MGILCHQISDGSSTHMLPLPLSDAKKSFDFWRWRTTPPRRLRKEWGQLPVTDATETFWQRFWATYRFRRNFGRESWWASFRGAIRAAWCDGPDQGREGDGGWR